MKQEIGYIMQVLEQMQKMNLSKKYMKSIENNENIKKSEIEDIELYITVEQIHEKGLINEFKEVEEKKEKEYQNLLRNELAKMPQLGPKIVKKCNEYLQAGEIDKLYDYFEDINKRIKTKVIRNEMDCNSYYEFTELKKAQANSNLLTKVFGISVEVLEDVKPEKVTTKRLNVPRVNIKNMDTDKSTVNSMKKEEKTRND